MLNCVIIDDEQFSIDALVKYIAELPRLNIVGIYRDPRIALDEIPGKNGLDLIFMDVDMPLLSGIELAGVLRSAVKKLIFTTSHSKYAFQAFEADADAYLLKPYTFAKFSVTINRLFPLQENEGHPSVAGVSDHFLVKSKEDNLRMQKVAFSEVIAFESSQNYVKIFLEKDKALIAYLTLKDVSDLLKDRPEFMQVHRAFIISVNAINYIEGNVITLRNNLAVTVGENYRESFSAYLSRNLFLTQRKK